MHVVIAHQFTLPDSLARLATNIFINFQLLIEYVDFCLMYNVEKQCDDIHPLFPLDLRKLSVSNLSTNSQRRHSKYCFSFNQSLLFNLLKFSEHFALFNHFLTNYFTFLSLLPNNIQMNVLMLEKIRDKYPFICPSTT